jgi:hypothetical protein
MVSSLQLRLHNSLCIWARQGLSRCHLPSEWRPACTAVSLERKRRSISGATPHRDVIGVQTPLGEQLLDVPVRQGKTQIPTNRQKDDFRFELPTLEQTGKYTGKDSGLCGIRQTRSCRMMDHVGSVQQMMVRADFNASDPT